MRTILSSSLRDDYRFEVVAAKEIEPRSEGVVRKTVRAGRFAFALARAIVCHRPALVHVHAAEKGSFWPMSAAALLCRAMLVPYVWHVHGPAFAEYASSHRGLLRYLFGLTLRRAGAVIVLSEQWRRTLRPLLPGASLHVVRNALELAAPIDRPADRGAMPLTLLCVGAVGQRKGSFDIVDAAALLNAMGDLPPFRFLLAGGEMWPGEWAELRRRRELVGARNVELLGLVEPTRVGELYAEADVFVLPSYAEGLPVAVLEAMRAGLPVVTAPVGAIPEIACQEGFVLVGPGDVDGLVSALARLLRQADSRRTMGMANRAHVEAQFHPERMAEELRQVYASVLDR